ncbi:aldo/keto reductase [Wenxinia marina]|uniref:Putative oxidoreductase n=1 Tax=Wenxinia marina DSM 24838 TaxID=1123501 RepID=A0A0D0PE97_9RHOB|nr:aldo/keto reductase [Wenxinia marina]KIQ69706.1 putative oxidoreductase [Wenxinia marina DSM 24838]GGL60551.1 NADP-dependent oxidoreductase [Wenxinia marina]
MDRTTLGRSGIEVSAWCLGTMTFGNQTEQDAAHRQISMALEAGIDFLDAAEMYPVAPVRAETVGRTERIIGNWLEETGRRDDVVIATKATGPNGGMVRDGAGYSGATLREIVEGSLRRLRTDRIDLYQLHWPERGSYHFRQNWTFDPRGQDTGEVADHMDGMVETLKALVAEGKIRAFGLSNETAWGTMQWIARAEAAGGPRVATVQNEYSLLARLYDTDMAEMAHHEDVTLLSFSPLGAGFLTGKYRGGKVPEGSRRSRVPDLGGRVSDRVDGAVEAYVGVAQKHGLDLVHMSLAWQRTRPFPVVPIIGATTVEQLRRILAGADVALSDEVLADIDAVHRAHPLPY